MRPVASVIAVCLVVGALTSSAAAHQATLSYSTIDVRGNDVVWRVRLGGDYAGPLAGLGERAIDRSELPTLERVLLASFGARLAVDRGGVPCHRTASELSADEHAGIHSTIDVAFAATFTCPASRELLQLRYDLYFDHDDRHQSIVNLTSDGRPSAAVFDTRHRTLLVAGDAGMVKLLVQFIGLGVEHILTGFDHLAFLLALLLVLVVVEGRFGVDALKTITAFTMAHSITLLAAAWGIVRLPSQLVESAIAASIVVVALANLRRSPPRARWIVTFVFGLIHGLGFASILAEAKLPRDATTGSVLCFNLGVELGQLGVLLVLLPLLLWARRRAPSTRRRIVDVGSVALALLGVVWLVGRLS